MNVLYLFIYLFIFAFYRGWDMYKSYDKEAWDVDSMSKDVPFGVENRKGWRHMTCC